MKERSFLRVLSSVTLCTSLERGRESERVEIMKREKLLNYTEDKDWASLIILPHHGAWQRNSHSDQQPTVSPCFLLFFVDNRRLSFVLRSFSVFLSVSLTALNVLFLAPSSCLLWSTVCSLFPSVSDANSSLSSPKVSEGWQRESNKPLRPPLENPLTKKRRMTGRDRDGKRYSSRTSIRLK